LKIMAVGLLALSLFDGASFEVKASDDVVNQAITTKTLDMTNPSHERLLIIRLARNEPNYRDFEVIFPERAENIKNIKDSLDKEDAISAAKNDLINIWKNMDLKGFTLVKKVKGAIEYKDSRLEAYGTRPLRDNEKVEMANYLGKMTSSLDGFVQKTFMSLDQRVTDDRTSWSVEIKKVMVEPTSRDVLRKIVNDQAIMYRTTGVIYDIEKGSIYFAVAPTLEIFDKEGKKFDAKITYKVSYNNAKKGGIEENITVEQKGE